MIQDRILLSHRGKLHWFVPDDILYFKGNGSYTEVATIDDLQILLSKNLKNVQTTVLATHKQFLRVQKSWIVNINHISYMQFDNQNRHLLRMNNGEDVPISELSIRNKLLSFYKASMPAKVILKKSIANRKTIVDETLSLAQDKSLVTKDRYDTPKNLNSTLEDGKIITQDGQVSINGSSLIIKDRIERTQDSSLTIISKHRTIRDAHSMSKNPMLANQEGINIELTKNMTGLNSYNYGGKLALLQDDMHGSEL